MVCYTGKSNQLKPLGDISGESLSCIAALGGFLFGDSIVKRIPLSQGKFAIVDDEEYDYLMQWKWYAHKNGRTYYAARHEPVCISNHKSRRIIWMHRIIAKTPETKQTDHVNHNGLDNRQINLRICSHSDNQHNRQACRNGSSKYKGVAPNGKRWMAYIRNNKTNTYIGTFISETEAAKAYDKKAKELFGEFACCNFGDTA